MCRIKSGTQIEEIYDVQNIVTACILRSSRPYSIPELSKTVKAKCEGSSIDITDAQIERLVNDTTMAFQRINLITAYNGQYYAYPVESQKRVNRRTLAFAD